MDKKYIYDGNVDITSKNSADLNEKLKKIQVITGNLYIYSNAELKADNLKSVGGDLCINSNVELKALKSVGGYLYINSNAELKTLKSVGGDLYIYSRLKSETEKCLWKNHKNGQWYLTDNCSEFLLSREGKITYKIKGIVFDKFLFDKVRKDQLSAQEVFAITNIEQRRIAYERMDKLKMKDLTNYKTLDDKTDNYGNPIRVVSFSINGYDTPFKYLNCVCPSSKREYFIETKQDTAEKAAAKSFGLNELKFDEEF